MDAVTVRRVFNCDPATGVLRWRINRPGSRGVGSEAGCVLNNGYRQVMFMGKHYLSHRLVWLHFYGEWPSGDIDHVNGDRADNAVKNLRVATPQENHQNRKIGANNKTGYMGVSLHSESGRFQASIKAYGVAMHLGFFEAAEDAAAAYVAAKAKYHKFQPTLRREHQQ